MLPEDMGAVTRMSSAGSSSLRHAGAHTEELRSPQRNVSIRKPATSSLPGYPARTPTPRAPDTLAMPGEAAVSLSQARRPMARLVENNFTVTVREKSYQRIDLSNFHKTKY